MRYSFVVTLARYLVRKTIGFRVDPDVEVDGIDEAEHAESGYEFSTFGGASGRGGGVLASAQTARESLER